MNKPRVFIGSSSEGLEVAKAIELHLARVTEPVVWDSGIFRPSFGALESLAKALPTFEFAVLVLTPDDLVQSRGEAYHAPRDNVLFELGLFTGHLGRERTFVVCDRSRVKMLSDWHGITIIQYEADRSNGSLPAALSPACTEIIDAIRTAPPRHSGSSPPPNPSDVFYGMEEVYNAITLMPTANTGVVITHTHTDWAWKLFPTILQWRLSNTPVTVFLTKPTGDSQHVRQERQRRRLLSALGAYLSIRSSIHVSGFFLDMHDPHDAQAIIFVGDPGDYQPLAIRYAGKLNQYAVHALKGRIPKLRTKPTKQPEGHLTVKALSSDRVIESLKQNVLQYRDPWVRIEEQTVPVGELSFLTRYVRSFKYNQIQGLYAVYRDAGVEPFMTMEVECVDGTKSVITPPVVESKDGHFVVIEGSTRAIFSLKKGLSKFNCLLVEGVEYPLPGTPVSIKDVGIVGRSLPVSQRIEDFDYRLFRHIERAVRPY